MNPSAALSSPQKLTAGSMVAVVLGAFLPWASIFGFSISGIKGDGKLTLVLALVGLVALAMHAQVVRLPHLGRKSYLIVSAIAAVLVSLIGLFDMTNFSAFGLYLTLFAGLTWLAAVIWDRRAGRDTAPAPEAPRPAEEELT